MRISDWSSDVCSSDLIALSRPVVAAAERGDIDMWVRAKPEAERVQLSIIDWHERQAVAAPLDLARRETEIAALSDGWTWRSEERRVGKECVRQCRSRWWPYN